MDVPKVFIARDDFPPITYELISAAGYEINCWPHETTLTNEELLKNVVGVTGIFCYPSPHSKITGEVVKAAGDQLKVISTCSVGYDHIDLDFLRNYNKKIRVGYTPGVLTEAVAEHAIALLLSTTRRVIESYNIVLNGGWTTKSWAPLWMCGYGLDKSTVGILGAGRIGLSIAKKLKSFNIDALLYYARSDKPEVNALGGKKATLEDICRKSDFIVCSLPLSKDTMHIINEQSLNWMKSNAIIVNIGRGPLIDQNALIKALQANKIGGAGLDVTEPEPLPIENPLLKMNNVVVTPHIGSATYSSRNEMGALAAKNLIAGLQDKPMISELKF